MASGKAKLMRKQRHQQRRKAQQGIQLTALMDVFTVLVFFLMVSQDNSTRLPQRADIHLPPAVVQTQPEESLTLQVSDDYIYLHTDPLISVEEVRKSDALTIAAVTKALRDYSAGFPLAQHTEEGRLLNIVAHKDIDYALLEKILTSAKQTEFKQVALAVLRQEVGEAQ